jgi:hypothetical protein
VRKAPAAGAAATQATPVATAAATGAAPANHVIPVPAKRGRPRRNAGRSLSERNPDFVDVPRSPTYVGAESPTRETKGTYVRCSVLRSISWSGDYSPPLSPSLSVSSTEFFLSSCVPLVFTPPRLGSFHHEAKIVRETFTFCDFFMTFYLWE